MGQVFRASERAQMNRCFVGNDVFYLFIFLNPGTETYSLQTCRMLWSKHYSKHIFEVLVLRFFVICRYILQLHCISEGNIVSLIYLFRPLVINFFVD